MTVDTSIYKTIQQPNMLQSMHDLVGTANAFNQYQISDINAQIAQQANKERLAVQPMMSQFMNQDGTFDLKRAAPAIMQVAPQTGPDIISKLSDTTKRQADANAAWMSQDNAQMEQASRGLPLLLNKEKTEQEKGLSDIVSAYPQTEQKINLLRHVLEQCGDDKVKRSAAIQSFFSQSMTLADLKKMQTPDTTAQSSVDSKTGISSTQQTSLSPTWATGIEQGSAVPGTKQQTSLAPGVGESMTRGRVDNVDQMNRHYAGLQDQASGSALALSLTGDIKDLAHRSITGNNADRSAYVNALLNKLGLGSQITGNLQTDTDTLEKKMAQLNLTTPASSDAARSLVSAARPHSGMSADAIDHAADALAGQIKANMAIRNHLTPYKYGNDPVGYQKARESLENIADPRVFQYMNYGKGTPEAQKFLSAMSAKERAELAHKADVLESMGVFK